MHALKSSIPIIRHFLVAAAIGTVAAALALGVYFTFWTESAEMHTIGRRPTQFRGQLTTSQLDDYGLVFTVGHNAGMSIKTTRRAVEGGADVIEIDVVTMGDTLIAAHEAPVAYVGRAVFQGPTLGEAWRSAANARVIQLDLKETTPTYRKKVISFLKTHPTDQTVMVATADVKMLTVLAEDVPDVFRFLSVPDAKRLKTLLNDDDLLALIDGVTIRYGLVNADSMTDLKASGLIVLAWTVNDLETVNRLVALGVDGISTDNLAIIGLLGGKDHGELRFQAYRDAPGPVEHALCDDHPDDPGEAFLAAPLPDPNSTTGISTAH